MAAPKGNTYASKTRKYDDKYCEELAKKLIDFANEESTLVIGKFCQHIVPNTIDHVHELAKRSETLKKALEYSTRVVGMRREELALLGKANHSVWAKTARMYDKGFVKAQNQESYDKGHYEAKGKLDAVVERKEDLKVVLEDFTKVEV